MAQLIDVPNDFRSFCRQMEFDLNLKDYKNKLIDWSRLDEILILKNQFFWINDFTVGKNIYVHPNTEKITGYPREKFSEFGFIFSITHPDDHDYAYSISKSSIVLTKDYRKELLDDPFFALFSVDMRIKCSDGSYIRVNRQTSCFRTDSMGNMVYALVLFTDISHLKKSNVMSFTCSGNIDVEKYFGGIIRKYHSNHNITVREREILSMLSVGASAPEIAKRLNISVHTVISHRKNLLQKTGTRKTAELVKYAVEKGVI